MTDCEHLRPDYDAYALGALEGEEREAIASHLARGCAACTQGVAESRTVVAQLALAAPPVNPAASVRKALLAWVTETRSSMIPAWAWLGAAALILFSVYTTWQTRALLQARHEQEAALQQQREISAQLAQQRRQLGQMQAVLTAADTREISLQPAKPGAPLPVVRAFWNEKQGLVLAASKVPAPGAGRTYQLWVVPKKGSPIGAGLFRPDEGQVLLITSAEARLADAAALAITDEPAGGSPQPTTTPLWVGPVR